MLVVISLLWLLLVQQGTCNSYGTCLGSGMEPGKCCSGSYSECLSELGSCSCDAACYTFNDCCSDIKELGCFPPEATCLGSGYTMGKCCDTETGDCESEDGSCYCDRLCHDQGDCCSDIEELECLSNTCLGSGFTDGQCCEGDDCTSEQGHCYCDQGCHGYGDCCEDILDMECYPEGSDVCVANGVGESSGCCEPSADSVCSSVDGTCFCDVSCYDNNDCCSDIDRLNCRSNTCKGSGHSSCCYSGNCVADDESCHCDPHCHNYGDCCSDIEDTCPAQE